MAEAKETRTEEEAQEGGIVAMADAVVHPRAVVVHAEDAAVALPAVVRAGWLRPATLVAETRRAALLFHLRAGVQAITERL